MSPQNAHLCIIFEVAFVVYYLLADFEILSKPRNNQHYCFLMPLYYC